MSWCKRSTLILWPVSLVERNEQFTHQFVQYMIARLDPVISNCDIETHDLSDALPIGDTPTQMHWGKLRMLKSLSRFLISMLPIEANTQKFNVRPLEPSP